MGADDLQRDVGRIEGEQRAMRREIEQLRAELAEAVKTINHVATTLDSTVAQVKGGWKTLLAAGSVASIITAGLFKIWLALKGH